MSEASHEVYTRLLLPKKHGYPLYIPGPHNNLPEEYRSEGVRIGDVGLITYDGGFDVLFNICLPADHPLNAGCVPEGFTQVQLRSREVIVTPDYHLPLSVIGSDLITKEVIDVGGHTNAPNLSVGFGLGYNFNSSAAEGALLVLPEGAHRLDLSNLRKFYDCAYTHAETWYEYVNGQLGRMVSNDSLYLVTGCDKSSSWALGSYSGGASAGGFSATFSAANIANGDISNVYSWERSGPATMRVGPSDRFAEGYHGNRNQGVFVRGLKIAVREGPFARLNRIKLTSTTSSVSDSVFRRLQKGKSPFTHRTQTSPVVPEHRKESRQDDVVVEPVPSRTKLYHPSDFINKLLLESFPNAQVAITHDDRWCNAIGEHTGFSSDYEISLAILTKYAPIVDSGRVFLLPKSSGVDPPRNVVGLEETFQLQRALDDDATRPSSLADQSLHQYNGFEKWGSILDLEKAITLQRKAVELTPDNRPEKLSRLIRLSHYYNKHFHQLQRLSDRQVVVSIPDDDVENPSWVANLVSKTVDERHYTSNTKPKNVHALGLFKSRPKNSPKELVRVVPIGVGATRQRTGPELTPVVGRGTHLRLKNPDNKSYVQRGEHNTTLQAALRGGYKTTVQLLQEDRSKVNAQGKYGDALLAASFSGDEAVVWLLLLEKGADVNIQGAEYDHALRVATGRGHEGVVRLLLEKGADVNAQGGRYGNALQGASLGGHEGVVRLLLEKGADVNAQGGWYGNALQGASQGGHKGVVRLLLEKGADVNAQGGWYGNALQGASQEGHEGVVRQLLEKGANVDAQGGGYANALRAASQGGHEGVVRLLLEKGADVDAQGGGYANALRAASQGGHEGVVRLLLEKGADVNAQGGLYGNALQGASRGGHECVVRLLLEKGADVNAQGGLYGNALQGASQGGHEDVVLLLLEKGAASRGHEGVLRRLLEKSANVNAQGQV